MNFDPNFISPIVQAACDVLIDQGFDGKVAMVINGDGTVTLHDYETYVDAVLAARGDEEDK